MRPWIKTPSTAKKYEKLTVTTAPIETVACWGDEVLVDDGLQVVVRTGGAGAGGCASVATFEHDLYVRRDDLDRARQIVAEDDDTETGEE